MGGTTWCWKSHFADMNLPWTRKLRFECGGCGVRRRLGMSRDYTGRPARPRLRYNRPLMDLNRAREVLRTEAQAILSLVDRLGPDFTSSVAAIAGCAGHVVVTGMGKAGLIAQKVSAT